MCGRFGFELPPKHAREFFGLERLEEYTPRRNIAPTTAVAVILAEPDATGQGLVRVLRTMQWGLVPAWAKDPSLGARLINARSETARDKPAFRSAFKRRRCLLPAQVFYEWRKDPDSKQPFAVGLAGGIPFAMAGLWEHWQGGDGSELLSATMLTTTANSLVAPIHDRMPVLVPPEAMVDWLDPACPLQVVQELLRPFPAEGMVAWPVTKAMSNPRNQEFSLDPVPLQQEGQPSLMG